MIPELREPSLLERFSNATSRWAGSSMAFTFAIALIAAWIICGPASHYSATWQLVMNTVSSIVTFVMVFLIQRAQNKESLATQIKLNELIAALNGARNALINAEDLSEAELKKLHDHYQTIIEKLPNMQKPPAGGAGPPVPADR